MAPGRSPPLAPAPFPAGTAHRPSASSPQAQAGQMWGCCPSSLGSAQIFAQPAGISSLPFLHFRVLSTEAQPFVPGTQRPITPAPWEEGPPGCGVEPAPASTLPAPLPPSDGPGASEGLGKSTYCCQAPARVCAPVGRARAQPPRAQPRCAPHLLSAAAHAAVSPRHTRFCVCGFICELLGWA